MLHGDRGMRDAEALKITCSGLVEGPTHQAQGCLENHLGVQYARDTPIAALNQNRTIFNVQTVNV